MEVRVLVPASWVKEADVSVAAVIGVNVVAIGSVAVSIIAGVSVDISVFVSVGIDFSVGNIVSAGVFITCGEVVSVSASCARAEGTPLIPKQRGRIIPTTMNPYKNLRIWLLNLVFIAFPPQACLVAPSFR